MILRITCIDEQTGDATEKELTYSRKALLDAHSEEWDNLREDVQMAATDAAKALMTRKLSR